MTVWQLIVREMVQRKWNAILSLVGVVAALALFVVFFTTGEASKRETTRLMRDMGFNIRIIPGDTDMGDFLATGMSAGSMPEDYADRLASHKGLSYSHLVATLQRQIVWRDTAVILTGIAPEVSSPDRQKSPMSFSVARGEAYVGYELVRSLGLKAGDDIDLLGVRLRIVQCLSETGIEDDIRIYAHLADVQEMVHEPGRINEVRALQCLCLTEGENTVDLLREQLSEVLPDARVLLLQSMADAREKQRFVIEKHLAVLMPLIMITCAAWLGILAMMNVRDRRQEIGLVRALGYGSTRIAALFLGRALGIGVVGGLVGFALGTGLALRFGPNIFKITAKMIRPEYGLLLWSMVLAPTYVSLSTLIPAVVAMTQDPADILREE